MFPGLQYTASFEIHLGKKYSSLEERHSKMNEMERESKKKTLRKAGLSLFTCVQLGKPIETKDITLGIDWLCVIAAQATHIIWDYFIQHTAEL